MTKQTPQSRAYVRLLKLAKGGKSLEEVCDSLKLHPRAVRKLVAGAKSAGFIVELNGDHVGRPPTYESVSAVKIKVSPVKGVVHFGVASDIHIGSKFFLKEYFLDHIKRMYEKGVRLVLVPGDILDGCYRHSRYEETHVGFDDQARYATEVFPQLPGLQYVGITGNHDQTFEDDSGHDLVTSLPMMFREMGRHDFRLIGARGGYVRLAPDGGGRGVVVELWHPGKGTAYALSYKLQKHVEGYAVGQKPDIVLAGHWHQQCYFTTRGVHAFSCGTFHGGQSRFGRMLGGAPSIGSWDIRVALTEQGTLREVSPTWNAYYEQENIRDV